MENERNILKVDTAEVFSNPDLAVNQLAFRDENTFKIFNPQNAHFKNGLGETRVLVFPDKKNR